MEVFKGIFIWTVFGAGIISFFSPCIFPLLPVYMGRLIEDLDGKSIKIGNNIIYIKAIINTLAFIAGLSTVFFILGYGAGALGNILYSPYINYIMGTIVIILGLHQMELINIKALQRHRTVEFNKSDRKGIIGAFLLGLSFSFGWTPCVGPVLSSILAVAASDNNVALYGGFLMMVYALGLAIPFIILALGSSIIMKHFSSIKRHMLLIKRIGGALIIIMGILLMLNQLNILSTIFH